jgi:hypothetical protein
VIYNQDTEKFSKIYRPEINTMMKIRGWERFQFLMDYEHQQVVSTHFKAAASFKEHSLAV